MLHKHHEKNQTLQLPVSQMTPASQYLNKKGQSPLTSSKVSQSTNSKYAISSRKVDSKVISNH